MQPSPQITSHAWYRQFWPWFLIVLPGSVVIASAITIGIAFSNQDSVVRDNYYREGLAINRELAASEQARAMNLTGTLRRTAAASGLEVTLSQPVSAVELQLTLVHPRHADRDFQAVLRLSDAGVYSVAGIDTGTLAQLQGNRQVILAPVAGEAWQLHGRIDFGRQATTALQP